MSKMNEGKTDKSSTSAFVTFWSTLPGILTGVAALITAIVGLYLAVGPKDSNHSAATTPTPYVTPKAEVRSGNCLEQEFAKVDPVEAGSGGQNLTTKDGLTRIKLTDNNIVVGGLRFKFYRAGDYFELEEVLDSKCQPVERLRNLSRQSPVDQNNKPRNWDRLELSLGGQPYSLRLGCDAGKCTADFRKL